MRRMKSARERLAQLEDHAARSRNLVRDVEMTTQAIVGEVDAGRKPMRKILMKDQAAPGNERRIETADDRGGQIPVFHRIDQQKLDAATIPAHLRQISSAHRDQFAPRSRTFGEL